MTSTLSLGKVLNLKPITVSLFQARIDLRLKGDCLEGNTSRYRSVSSRRILANTMAVYSRVGSTEDATVPSI